MSKNPRTSSLKPLVTQNLATNQLSYRAIKKIMTVMMRTYISIKTLNANHYSGLIRQNRNIKSYKNTCLLLTSSLYLSNNFKIIILGQ